MSDRATEEDYIPQMVGELIEEQPIVFSIEFQLNGEKMLVRLFTICLMIILLIFTLSNIVTIFR